MKKKRRKSERIVKVKKADTAKDRWVYDPSVTGRQFEKMMAAGRKKRKKRVTIPKRRWIDHHKDYTQLFVRQIPRELKNMFKAACVRRNRSMTDYFLYCMRALVKADGELPQHLDLYDVPPEKKKSRKKKKMKVCV